MLIKEYRIPLPMSVEEYRIAQLYMIQVTLSNIYALCIVFRTIYSTILNSLSLAATSFANMQSQIAVCSCQKLGTTVLFTSSRSEGDFYC